MKPFQISEAASNHALNLELAGCPIRSGMRHGAPLAKPNTDVVTALKSRRELILPLPSDTVLGTWMQPILQSGGFCQQASYQHQGVNLDSPPVREAGSQAAQLPGSYLGPLHLRLRPLSHPAGFLDFSMDAKSFMDWVGDKTITCSYAGEARSG